MTKKDAKKEAGYWNGFYAGKTQKIPHTPSQFATFVATSLEENAGSTIVEFGCGNARDAHFFANSGFLVLATDKSTDAINRNIDESKSPATFTTCDVAQVEQVNATLTRARDGKSTVPMVVYSRFFLHTLDQLQEDSFLQSLALGMNTSEKLFFEFRSTGNAEEDKFFGNDHFRRFINPDDFSKKLTQLGFAVTYIVTGHGMAPYKDEDPEVCRVIAVKN